MFTFLRPTRRAQTFALLLLVSVALGQQPAPMPAQPGVLLSSKSDVFIRVTKSAVGPDYVKVQMLAEDYPVALFTKQCQAVGTYNKTNVRGLEISYAPTGASPSGKPGRILTANFATDGLIDSKAGKFELNALAKAFAGAPDKYQIKTLAVVFEGQTPKENVTLKDWKDSAGAVTVTAQYDPNAAMIEYRIDLKTQNPDEIAIPSTIQGPTKPAEMPSNEKPKTNLIPWIFGAAVVVGLLVYFALRPYRKANSPSGRDLR